MIQQLIDLGKSIQMNWELESFPTKAHTLLSEIEVSVSLEDFETEVTTWLQNLNKLPEQVNLYNAFGEPSVTLFNNGKFAIDVYFWRKNDTAIHSHAFRGAFKVLFGKSLHEEFEVEYKTSFGKGLSSSALKTLKTTPMNAGATQIILPGNQLVHRLLHIDNPTVSLCMRTVDDLELNQWHHLSSGLSCQKTNLDQLVIKKILYFQYLQDSNPKTAKSFLNTLLDSMETSTQIALYEGLFQNEFGLDYPASSAAVEHIASRFLKMDWFHLYEDHQRKMNQNLLEVQASKGSLKVLAHAINCNYSFENTKELLGSFGEKNITSLCQELLAEDHIFSQEHHEQQIQKIENFSKTK